VIGRFILGENPNNTRMASRGVGPSLAQLGLNPVRADPTLELHDANGALLIANDNWTDDTASAASLTANGLGRSDPKESGIFASLPAGQSTAILAGKNGGDRYRNDRGLQSQIGASRASGRVCRSETPGIATEAVDRDLKRREESTVPRPVDGSDSLRPNLVTERDKP
jgi:hypothetical protein